MYLVKVPIPTVRYSIKIVIQNKDVYIAEILKNSYFLRALLLMSQNIEHIFYLNVAA
jgi:hypothetical protein